MNNSVPATRARTHVIAADGACPLARTLIYHPHTPSFAYQKSEDAPVHHCQSRSAPAIGHNDVPPAFAALLSFLTSITTGPAINGCADAYLIPASASSPPASASPQLPLSFSPTSPSNFTRPPHLNPNCPISYSQWPSPSLSKPDRVRDLPRSFSIALLT